MLDLNLDLLKEDVKSEPDFAKRDELYQQKSAEYLQTATDQISSPRVKAALNSYYSLKFPREALKFRVENLKDWGVERVAQTDALGDQMANLIVSTNDPQESAKYRGLYMSQLNELSLGPHAPLTATKRRDMESDFNTKVITRQQTRRIAQDPTGWLATADDDPEFQKLPGDQQEKIKASAVATEQRYQRVADKTTKDIHDLTMNNVQIKANFGTLSGNEQTALLNGTFSRYLSAKEGEVLVNHNNNPATGAGSSAAKVIWSEYLSGPRTPGRINATRAKLNHLQAEIGQPDALIMKYNNELQSDQDQQLNQGIQLDRNAIMRQDKEIKNLQTEYDATVTQPAKWMQSLPGYENRSKAERAQLDTTYRQQGAEAAKKQLESYRKKDPKAGLSDRQNKVIEAQ
jgi:hypothetical protein